MLDLSNFASSTLVKREVELADGKKHDLMFKEPSAIDIERYGEGKMSKDRDTRLAATAELIVACLCNEDGSPALSLEQAVQLKWKPRLNIVNVIEELAGFGEAQKNA